MWLLVCMVVVVSHFAACSWWLFGAFMIGLLLVVVLLDGFGLWCLFRV